MAKSRFKDNKDKRDGSTFLLLPRIVLESLGYRRASYTARALLIDLAIQYKGFNNGKLVTCSKAMAPQGWNSNATVSRAVRELIDCGLIVETRKGCRPNKAAWFALSWAALDEGPGLDIDPKHYHRGGYKAPEKPAISPQGKRTAAATAARQMQALSRRHGYALTPSDGVATVPIAPIAGVSTSMLAPSAGAVGGKEWPIPTPSAGAYLEIPSTPAAAGSVGSGAAFSPSLLAALQRRTVRAA